MVAYAPFVRQENAMSTPHQNGQETALAPCRIQSGKRVLLDESRTPVHRITRHCYCLVPRLTLSVYTRAARLSTTQGVSGEWFVP